MPSIQTGSRKIVCNVTSNAWTDEARQAAIEARRASSLGPADQKPPTKGMSLEQASAVVTKWKKKNRLALQAGGVAKTDEVKKAFHVIRQARKKGGRYLG